ncbi:MAG: hypothetical protein M1816_005284 [Peltula sp. TS41687]|nr:MAG: hypothetical protein M1816_005284 [Peltula sp. TS41687]
MSGEDFSNALCINLLAASDPRGYRYGQPSRPFPFLDLPPEIRNKIYELLLVSDEPITRLAPSQPEKMHWDHLYHPIRHPGLSTAILRVNKQIYAEASAVLYGANKFRYWIGEWYRHYVRERKRIFENDELWTDLEAIAPRNLRQMTKLSISVFIYGLGGPTPLMRRRILQSLTAICDELKRGHHLRCLSVKIEYLWEMWGRYMDHPATEHANHSGRWCRYTSDYIDLNVAKRVQSLLKPFDGLDGINSVSVYAPTDPEYTGLLEELMEGLEGSQVL